LQDGPVHRFIYILAGIRRVPAGLDEIALAQLGDKNVAGEEFQVWKLTVSPDHTATLTCDDGNDHIVFAKQIEYTDFPLAEIALYFANNTISLPSEY
jgi:hypothetical protein